MVTSQNHILVWWGPNAPKTLQFILKRAAQKLCRKSLKKLELKNRLYKSHKVAS